MFFSWLSQCVLFCHCLTRSPSSHVREVCLTWGQVLPIWLSAAFCMVVGIADGCLICVKPPTEDAICFLNGKLLHFVQSQAVCGHTAKLSDVFTGFLENSPIIFLQKCCPRGSWIIMHPLRKLQQDSWRHPKSRRRSQWLKKLEVYWRS